MKVELVELNIELDYVPVKRFWLVEVLLSALLVESELIEGRLLLIHSTHPISGGMMRGSVNAVVWAVVGEYGRIPL